MRHPDLQASPRAFTLVELLTVLAIIAILAGLLLPALGRAKPKARQVQCVAQLKEVGIAFHLFANDHQHRYPMQVPIRDGGSEEYVPGGNAFRHVLVLANELSTPRILACPSDNRSPAPSFSSFDNRHLSYFIGVDATPRTPNSLLAGDRNISTDDVVRSNALSNPFAVSARWTADLHDEKGNILFSDGHVSRLNTEGLRAAVRAANPPQP